MHRCGIMVQQTRIERRCAAENIVTRKITCDEVESAMSLALEVFMQFEAPDYDLSGVESVKRDIVENPEYLENARQGVCPIDGAFDGDKIVALMGMRSSKTHINLVFTKKEYYRKDIARGIFHYLLNDILAENPTLDALTLNSSPFISKIQRHYSRKAVVPFLSNGDIQNLCKALLCLLSTNFLFTERALSSMIISNKFMEVTI